MDDIKSKTTVLSNELSKIGEILSKTQPAGGEAAGPDTSGGVRDADFEEKKPEEGK